MTILDFQCLPAVFAQCIEEYHQKFSASFGIFQNKDARKIITIVYVSMVFGVHMDQDFSTTCISMTILVSCGKGQ